MLLVEEDEEVVVYPVAQTHSLRMRMYVLEACRPEEAIRLAEQHQEPIHLLLSDVVMPEMGGGQLGDGLITWPGIRVMYMSDTRIIRTGASWGTGRRSHLLTKPFTPVALASKVRQVLDLPSGTLSEQRNYHKTCGDRNDADFSFRSDLPIQPAGEPSRCSSSRRSWKGCFQFFLDSEVTAPAP